MLATLEQVEDELLNQVLAVRLGESGSTDDLADLAENETEGEPLPTAEKGLALAIETLV
ncbi:hypothetical protein [Thermopirellula anaerolimosa]